MTDEQGEPWFVLKDICAALEIENTSRVAGRLEEDDLTTSKVTDNLGRNQLSFLISEAGLYEVIFMSRKPEAKVFKRWVTSEVLPSIRKHGMYATPATIEEMIANPDIIIQLATTLKEERAARAKAEAEVAALGHAIETAEGDLAPVPLARYCRRPTRTWDPTSSADGSLTTTLHSVMDEARLSPCKTPLIEESSSSLNASTQAESSGRSSSSHPQDRPTSLTSSASRHEKRRHLPWCRLFFLP